MWLCRSQRQKYPDSSSLARSGAPEPSELCLPLLWRGYFFLLFFYMQIKLQDYCGFPSLLTSAVSLLSDSTWPRFPALGTGQEIWFLLPVTFSTAPEGAEQMFPAWWGQGALCTQQVQEELAPVKQELGNDLIEFATDEPVLVKAEFPGGLPCGLALGTGPEFESKLPSSKFLVLCPPGSWCPIVVPAGCECPFVPGTPLW